MRVGFISQWYDPEGASAALPGVIARALASQGASVEVLTGFPNYPHGAIADGYRVRPYQHEVVRGVSVHRAPLWPNHDNSGTKRALNYLSYASGATAVALSRFPRVDAALVHSTPATAALPAIAMKKLRRTPYVLHIQDLWPQTVLSSGFMSPRTAQSAERHIHQMCDLAYRHASQIAVTAPGMIDLIAARGVDRKRLHFVPNWADEQAFRPAPKDPALAVELGLTAPFVVMYAGNFGEYQALDVLLSAARSLQHHTEIQFAFVGGGVMDRTIREAVATEGLSNVVVIGAQPFERMADILALGDVQYIGLAERSLFETTLPSKIQATLAAGRPILGNLTGDARTVVLDSGAGVVPEAPDGDSVAEMVLELASAGPKRLHEMGAAGRHYYQTKFSHEASSSALLRLLAEAASETTS